MVATIKNARETACSKTSQETRVNLVRGISPLIDDEGELECYADNLTVAGWYVKEVDAIHVQRLHAYTNHAESFKVLNALKVGADEPDKIVPDTLEWVFRYGSVKEALPAGVEPVVVHLQRELQVASAVTSADAGVEGLTVKVINLATGATFKRVGAETENIRYKVLPCKRIGACLATLRNFCGKELFVYEKLPDFLQEYRAKAKPEPREKDQAPAQLDKLDAEELMAAMCSLGSSKPKQRQKSPEHKPKSDSTAPTRPVPKRQLTAPTPVAKAEEHKLPEVNAACKLSQPQKDLVLRRLADIGVKDPGIAQIPVRRGRLTRLEKAGGVSFTGAQMAHINAILKPTDFKLEYVEEHNVYALRHMKSSLTYVFTRRDWEFVAFGKESRRYSGK